MRGWITFIILLVVMASFSFVAASMNSEKEEVKEESKIIEFSTFTSAVCENKANLVHCKDEMFVKCNGTISKAVDVAECNGFKLDVPKTLGFAVFDKEWKDPRN